MREVWSDRGNLGGEAAQLRPQARELRSRSVVRDLAAVLAVAVALLANGCRFSSEEGPRATDPSGTLYAFVVVRQLSSPIANSSYLAKVYIGPKSSGVAGSEQVAELRFSNHAQGLPLRLVWKSETTLSIQHVGASDPDLVKPVLLVGSRSIEVQIVDCRSKGSCCVPASPPTP